MTIIAFVRDVLGTVPAQYDYLVYLVSMVILITFVAITIKTFLGILVGFFR